MTKSETKLFEKVKFLRQIKERYDYGFQNVLLTVGGTNTGKSFFNFYLYYIINKFLLHRDFDENDFYYSVTDFAKNISTIRQQVVFYDEAGRDLDIRSWNSLFNRLMSFILQTQRVQRNFYFIILPHKRLLTQTHLVLFNYYIIMKNLVRKVSKTKRNISRTADVYNIQTQHFDIGSRRSFVLYKFNQRLTIPDFTHLSKKKAYSDFPEWLKKFDKLQITKKKDIAHEIEDEAKLLEKQKELKKQKVLDRINKLSKRYE